MSFNTFGKLFRFSTWGESHGPAIGCVVDGCPPNISIKEQDIQIELDKRKPGQSKFTTQRKEDDKVQILSGVFEGKTTGTPISLIIYNKDMRSKDYGNMKDKCGPCPVVVSTFSAAQTCFCLQDFASLGSIFPCWAAVTRGNVCTILAWLTP